MTITSVPIAVSVAPGAVLGPMMDGCQRGVTSWPLAQLPGDEFYPVAIRLELAYWCPERHCHDDAEPWMKGT